MWFPQAHFSIPEVGHRPSCVTAKRLAAWDTGTAVNLTCVPPCSRVEALTPDVTVSGGGAREVTGWEVMRVGAVPGVAPL